MKDSSQPGNSILGFTKDQPARVMATVKWQRSCLWGWKSTLPVFSKQGNSRRPQCASIFWFPLFTLRNYETEVERDGVKRLQMSLSFTSEQWYQDGGDRGWQEKRFLKTYNPPSLPPISPCWRPFVHPADTFRWWCLYLILSAERRGNRASETFKGSHLCFLFTFR